MAVRPSGPGERGLGLVLAEWAEGARHVCVCVRACVWYFWMGECVLMGGCDRVAVARGQEAAAPCRRCCPCPRPTPAPPPRGALAGECVGIAFQSLKNEDTENISYIIPTPGGTPGWRAPGWLRGVTPHPRGGQQPGPPHILL